MELNIVDMIKPELLVLIPVCWGIGILIRATKCPNKFIPFINALISVILAFLYVFSSSSINSIGLDCFISITQGIVCWAISWVTYDKFIKSGVENDYKVKLTSTNGDGVTQNYTCKLDDDSSDALG